MRQIAIYAVLAVVLVWTLVPILWMVLSSFKTGTALLSPTPTFFFTPSLEHYAALLTSGGLGGYFLNSVLAAGISTVIAVVLGSMAGYGLARSHFRGKQHVAFWIISTRMAPIAAVVLPLFILFRYVNLLDSIPSRFEYKYLCTRCCSLCQILPVFYSRIDAEYIFHRT